MDDIKAPLISVIVPIYNMEHTLSTSLESLSNQTYDNYEIILVDDGSTDNSNFICKQFIKQDSRFRLYYKKNGGVSEARNLGLSKAKGEWITFFDADDKVCSKWLSEFDVRHNQNFDILCQGICADKAVVGPNATFKEYGFNFNGNIPDLINKLTRFSLLGYVFIKCFKRSIISHFNIHFDTKVKFQEDELFVLEYLKHARTGLCVDTKNYLYYGPDWGKYRTNDLENSIYRVEKTLYLLLDMFKGEKTDIVIGKMNRLNLLIMENLLKQINHNDFKKLSTLYSQGYGYSKIPVWLQTIFSCDKTYISFLILLSFYRFKRFLSFPNYV